MIALARRAAFDALAAIDRGTELPAALARTRAALADERDRALAAAIVTGTLRWRARLDHLAQQASKRPLSRLDAEVLQVLRLSLFQLLFLDRVPASAVVDDAVSLTKATGKTSAAGFVNAVLRTVTRSRDRLDLPTPPDLIRSDADRAAVVRALAIGGSHPQWLIERWVDRLGPDVARAWVDFNNAEPPVTLRVNRRRATRDEIAERLRAFGVESRPTPYAPDGLVAVTGHPLQTPLAESGDFLVQDEASQIVPLALGVRPGDRVLDACAAPGGKALVIADRLGVGGLLVAADLRPRRLRVLGALLARHGAASSLLRHDAAAGVPFGPVFDRVLVDAPCTGLGTLRRDVDIRWRRSEQDVIDAAARQERLIAQAAQSVRPGGRLVYATCSSEPEENEQIVERFLSQHPEFSLVPRSALVADGVPEVLIDAGSGFVVTRPDRHGLENFFAAAITRI